MANMMSALKGLSKAGKPAASAKKKVNMAHPGFKAVQDKIAKKEGVSKESAGAILANASRHASPAAKKANPKLNKV